MATYYNPDGNPEVWDEGKQPENYLTPEEWEKLHPTPPPPHPTREELIANLTAEYTQGRWVSRIDGMYLPENADEEQSDEGEEDE